jgi:hypothetical protein
MVRGAVTIGRVKFVFGMNVAVLYHSVGTPSQRTQSECSSMDQVALPSSLSRPAWAPAPRRAAAHPLRGCLRQRWRSAEVAAPRWRWAAGDSGGWPACIPRFGLDVTSFGFCPSPSLRVPRPLSRELAAATITRCARQRHAAGLAEGRRPPRLYIPNTSTSGSSRS